MSEFKTGDRVALLDNHGMSAPKGAVGRVIRDSSGDGLIHVEWIAGSASQSNGGYDPARFKRIESTDPTIPALLSLERALGGILGDIQAMMVDRHRKYGPGNIAKHGPLGILVRMDDKFARLEAGQDNFDDETVENTLDDIIGYALIWKLWLHGDWPGSKEQKLDQSS